MICLKTFQRNLNKKNEMASNTYVLLSRSILDSEVFASQKLLKIWVWCLCKANHKDRFISLKVGRGEKTVKVKRGQFLFGRFKAEEELFIDGSTIYTIMKRLEKLGNIDIKSSNQYSVITICNYNTYQDPDSYKVTTNKQPTNSKATTKPHPSNTNNNVNNVKNENKREEFITWLNYRIEKKKPIIVKATFDSLVKKFNSESIEKIKWVIDYSIQNGYQGLFWDKYTEKTDQPKKRVINHYEYKCPNCSKIFKPREMKGDDDFDSYRCDENGCQTVGLGKDGKNMVGVPLKFVKIIYKE